MSTVRSLVTSAETTQRRKQIFRFVRIVVLGVLAAVAAGAPLTVVALAPVAAAAAETAFRQIFPA